MHPVLFITGRGGHIYRNRQYWNKISSREGKIRHYILVEASDLASGHLGPQLDGGGVPERPGQGR